MLIIRVHKCVVWSKYENEVTERLRKRILGGKFLVIQRKLLEGDQKPSKCGSS